MQVINGLRKIAPGISEESKQIGTQVVTNQLQASQHPVEKAQLAGLLGSLGGANQATIDVLEQMIDQEVPAPDPERFQEVIQRMQAAGLPEEQISVALAAMSFQSMSHDRSAALYNLGLIKGDVDGIGILLEKFRTSTSSDELATILVTLRRNATDRPEVFEVLCEVARTAEELELCGVAIYGLIDMGGDNPEIITMMNDALAARSDYFESLLVRANIYAQQQKTGQALADCDRAMSLNAADINPWFLKAKILFDQERYGESIAANQQLLQLQPEDWSAWYNIACCYAKQNQPQEAIEALARAVAISPSEARSTAVDDRDLDSLSTLPEFQCLINDD